MALSRLRSKSIPRVEVTSPAAGETIRSGGEYLVRWRAADNDGFDDAEAVSDAFSAEGGPPEVRIREPREGTRVREGDHLQLSGEAFDDAGLFLDGGQLKWFAGNRFLATGSQAIAEGLTPSLLEVRLEATDAIGRMAAVRVEVGDSCFREKFSGPGTVPDGCSMTVRSGTWEVSNGELLGSTTDAEGWAWAGAPPVESLPGADDSIQYRFLSQPNTEVGRHGGIMFCARAATRRGAHTNPCFTLDWIDRDDDHSFRLSKWKLGAGETLAIGRSDLRDPPEAWRVEMDGPPSAALAMDNSSSRSRSRSSGKAPSGSGPGAGSRSPPTRSTSLPTAEGRGGTTFDSISSLAGSRRAGVTSRSIPATRFTRSQALRPPRRTDGSR